MDEQRSVEAGFRALEPWYYSFAYDGRRYGGSFDECPADLRPPEHDRLRYLFDRLPDLGSVLELGTFEARDTLLLAQRYPRVTTVEARSRNVEKARFLSRLYGLDGIEVVQGDLEELDLASLGSFDAVVCCGILYHMKNPRRLLERIRRASGRAFVWTHVWAPPDGLVQHEGYEMKRVVQAFPIEEIRGIDDHSYWFTKVSLLACLRDVGFSTIEVFWYRSSGGDPAAWEILLLAESGPRASTGAGAEDSVAPRSGPNG